MEALVPLSFKVVIVLSFLLMGEGNNFTFTRNKRYLPLIFQNPAAITFISGFGIPVNNLNPELVTVGMVFKAQQVLPTTNKALRHQANHSINKREHISEGMEGTPPSNIGFDVSRIMFYKALEQMSISMGQAGKTCVLKTICEVSASPLDYRNGLFGEILHILFTPSSTMEVPQAERSDYKYLEAERNGRGPMTCADLYRECNESILERITNLFD